MHLARKLATHCISLFARFIDTQAKVHSPTARYWIIDEFAPHDRKTGLAPVETSEFGFN